MIDIPKPTISELYSKYILEPSLRDIYVEGIFDRELLEQCARIENISDLYFYEINLVEIPESLLQDNKLTFGNKQKVIALARALSAIDSECGYRCVVDRDLDHWLGTIQDVPRLIYTKYCDVESYFLSSKLVRHLLVTICKCRIRDWDLFYVSFINVLKSMYAMRVCDRRLGWCLVWLSFDRCLSSSGSEVVFSVDDYLSRLLAYNRHTNDLEPFSVQYLEFLRVLTDDPRTYVRGHDFVELMALSVKKFGGVDGFRSNNAVERLLIAAAAEVDEIGALIAA